MAHFNLDNYVTVAERITQFWAEHPNGRIETRLEHVSADSKLFAVWSAVYKDAADEKPWATGLAEEHFGQSGPNQTSPLENCESSSIGRALANAGYATTAEGRPSREEMQKVAYGNEAPRAYAPPAGGAPSAPAAGEKIDKSRNGVIWYFFNKDGKAADAYVATRFGVKRTQDLTIEQFTEMMGELNPHKVKGRTIDDVNAEQSGAAIVAGAFGLDEEPF